MIIASEDTAKAWVAEQFGTEAFAKLDLLKRLLQRENDRQNLVAAATIETIWQRHFVDSLQLLSYVSRETGGLWVDIGSGAGFPGLAIAIARPDFRLALVEPRRRRCEWLTEAAANLDLRNVEVICGKAQTITPFPADVISARALASLPKIIDMAGSFSTPDTQWVLPKGRKAAQEVAELPKKLRKMFHVEQSITDPDAGIVVGNLSR